MNEEKFKEVVSEKSKEIKVLRDQVRIKDEQIQGLRAGVAELLRVVDAKDLTIEQVKRKKAELSDDVFTAYDERARLLAFIASEFPSIIKIDLDAPNPDYSNVLYIILPTGKQISFHIFKGQLEFLPHVPRMNCHGKFVEPWMDGRAYVEGTTDLEWDKHSTEEKWARLADFIHNQINIPALDEERSAWYPIEVNGNTINL